MVIGLYRLALLSFPAEFRRRFAVHMTETFEQYCNEAGTWAGCRAVIEALVQGLKERSTRIFTITASRLGNDMQARSDFTQTNVVVRFSGVFKDARFAFRGFRRAPTFTITALIILTVGIGASAAVPSARRGGGGLDGGLRWG
jgi:hypothetical protein